MRPSYAPPSPRRDTTPSSVASHPASRRGRQLDIRPCAPRTPPQAPAATPPPLRARPTVLPAVGSDFDSCTSPTPQDAAKVHESKSDPDVRLQGGGAHERWLLVQTIG